MFFIFLEILKIYVDDFTFILIYIYTLMLRCYKKYFFYIFIKFIYLISFCFMCNYYI